MDIRELIQAMTADDKHLFDKCRTDMRRAYLIAHNKTVNLVNWTVEDDAFMDMIDIKLATLFDRDGRIVSTKPVICNNDAQQTVVDLHLQDDKIKAKLIPIPQIVSEASKMLADDRNWGSRND